MRKNECTFHGTWRSNSKTWLLLMKSWMSKAETWMLRKSKLNVGCKKVESRVQTQMTNTKCRIDMCKVQCKLKHWRSIWSFDGGPCCSLSKIGAVYGCSSQGTVSMTISILFCSVEMMMRKRRWKLNSKLRTLSDCKTWNFFFSERLKLVF